MKCRMLHFGKGPAYWARCEGCHWAWLGTYKPAKGRRTRARAEWIQHHPNVG